MGMATLTIVAVVTVIATDPEVAKILDMGVQQWWEGSGGSSGYEGCILAMAEGSSGGRVQE